MSHKRVLVIDDEDDIREVASTALELTEEWEMAAAMTGRQGVKLARMMQPDVILLDVMMPDMDGPATFVELQREPDTRHIPVIFLTAKVQGADRRRFEDLGVRGVIAKPFDPLTLGRQVSEILEWT
jgi:CheY-like chemotaxis protein